MDGQGFVVRATTADVAVVETQSLGSAVGPARHQVQQPRKPSWTFGAG